MSSPDGQLRVVWHETTRTGGPVVLLHLLRYLRDRTQVQLSMELQTGGPLAEQVVALAALSAHSPPSALLVNSALAAECALAYPPGLPAMLYVHEDRGALDVLPNAARRAIIDRYQRVLCVSEQAEQDLIALGVSSDRLVVLPPVVARRRRASSSAVALARASIGAGPGDRVVLGCGEASWRKGADHFVALAHALAGEPDLRFGWVGLRPRPFARQLDHDVDTLGLAGRLRWLGDVEDTQPLLEAADVLTVLSRNDPQPLVPVEAALVGTPSVGFAIGGMIDLAADGAALTVPYPDIDGVARLVRQVLADQPFAECLAAAGTARWQRHQAINVIGPRFADEVGCLLGRGPHDNRVHGVEQPSR